MKPMAIFGRKVNSGKFELKWKLVIFLDKKSLGQNWNRASKLGFFFLKELGSQSDQ